MINAANDALCDDSVPGDDYAPHGTVLEGLVGDFVYISRRVRPALREAVLHALPRLRAGTPDAAFCLRLTQYLMFPLLFSRTVVRGGEAGVVVPCRTLAVLDGVRWTRSYRAGERLRVFEDLTGVRLNVGGWDYATGEARSVWPEWPACLLAARSEELARCGLHHQRVFFDTGGPCRRGRRARCEEEAYRELRRELASRLPDDHPQRAVLELLNGQSEAALRKVVRRNMTAARGCVLAMPQGSAAERRSRECAMAVLDAVSQHCGMAYRAVGKTARVYAIGQSLHLLPREVRRLLLAGGTTLDLRAAQLAVAARVWDVPLLQERLRGAGNYWQVMLDELGVAPGGKPALKTATYALLFGKSVSAVVRGLTEDLGGLEVDRQAALRFSRHPVTRSLVKARKRRTRRVEAEGGLTTAFGKWVDVTAAGQGGIGRPRSVVRSVIRSALAEEMQSFEQRLMMPALEVIASVRGVRVLSYLHDGMTVHFEDRNKRAGTVSRMRRAVDELARELGIVTVMEEE